MSEKTARSYLSQGWLLFFLWPPVVIFLMAMLARAVAMADWPGWDVVVIGFGGLGVFAVTAELFLRFIKWVINYQHRNPYGCPVCGYDIRATPHKCPECGTRLLWGHLPGPRDRDPRGDFENVRFSRQY